MGGAQGQRGEGGRRGKSQLQTSPWGAKQHPPALKKGEGRKGKQEEGNEAKAETAVSLEDEEMERTGMKLR